MMLLRACPKCGGDLNKSEDLYGEYFQCIQCGFLQDVGGGPSGGVIQTIPELNRGRRAVGNSNT